MALELPYLDTWATLEVGADFLSFLSLKQFFLAIVKQVVAHFNAFLKAISQYNATRYERGVGRPYRSVGDYVTCNHYRIFANLHSSCASQNSRMG